MRKGRRVRLASAAVAISSLLAGASASAQGVKIGILNDQSGVYADYGGKGSIEAARMAIEDFGGSVLGQKIELVSAGVASTTDTSSGAWITSSGPSMESSRASATLDPSSVRVSVTRVPHPDGSSLTVPLAAAPSQATAVSGSSLVIRISPNAPRCRASDAASLHSDHSSGVDLTSVRLV